MFYTVYEITNIINEKRYIGVHKTSNLDDGYMGSGTLLKRAQLKYGLENFTKKILFIFDNEKAMYDKECELLTEELLKSNDFYNIMQGGFGGFNYINGEKKNLYGSNGSSGHGLENISRGREKFHTRLKTDLEYKKKFSEKISKLKKEGYVSGILTPGFQGKTHSEETKKILSEKSSIHQSGTKNSQYGTMWISNNELKISKKIKKTEKIPDGWVVGMNTWKLLEKKRIKEEFKKTKRLKKQKEIEQLYDIYVVGGFNAVKAAGYKFSYSNLVQTFAKYIDDFIPQNDKKQI